MASEINVLSANIFDIGQACEYVQRLEVDRPFREKEGEREPHDMKGKKLTASSASFYFLRIFTKKRDEQVELNG